MYTLLLTWKLGLLLGLGIGVCPLTEGDRQDCTCNSRHVPGERFPWFVPERRFHVYWGVTYRIWTCEKPRAERSAAIRLCYPSCWHEQVSRLIYLLCWICFCFSKTVNCISRLTHRETFFIIRLCHTTHFNVFAFSVCTWMIFDRISGL